MGLRSKFADILAEAFGGGAMRRRPAEDMQVILHLGAHKTGTSLIQKFIRDKKRIMRRNGVAALSRSLGDKLIGWGDESFVRAGGEELNKDISDCAARRYANYVLSHENSLGRPIREGQPDLYPSAARSAAVLKETLRHDPLRVVYYIRSQPRYLESYYLQTIHEGKSHSFDDWYSAIRGMNFSWRPLYVALSSAFGPENVLLRSFDDDMANGQEEFLRRFFASFMNVRSAAFRNFDYRPVRNPSLGDKGLKIALAANPHLETHAERRLMRNFLQANFSNRQFPRPVLLSGEEAGRLNELYAAENAELVETSRAATKGWRFDG